MKRQVVLDTGPLVALLNRGDRHHQWARNQWGQMTPPLFTCEAVLAEACFLVRRFADGQTAVLELARRGILDLSFRLTEETGRHLSAAEEIPKCSHVPRRRLHGADGRTASARGRLYARQRFLNLPKEQSSGDPDPDAARRTRLSTGTLAACENTRILAFRTEFPWFHTGCGTT